MINHALLNLLLLAAPPPGVEVEYNQFGELAIPNYWRHIKEIYRALEEREKPPNQQVESRYPPPREFAFDAVSHLEMKHLLRACEESIAEVELKRRNEPERVQHAAIEENLHRCLEFAPMVAKGPETLDLLITTMKDANDPPALRLYLLRRVLPGFAPPCLMGAYLQDAFRYERDDLAQALADTAAGELEDPEVQALAIELLYQVHLDALNDAIAQDRPMARYADEKGVPADIALLDDPKAPKPGRRAEQLMKNPINALSALPDLVGDHLDPASRKTPEVREQSRKVLNWVRKNAPVNSETKNRIYELLKTYPKVD